MTEITLGVRIGVRGNGGHDPSAAIFRDGHLELAVEEERYTREKHAIGSFPEQSISACLDALGVVVEDVDQVTVPLQPDLLNKWTIRQAKKSIHSLRKSDRSFLRRCYKAGRHLNRIIEGRLGSVELFESEFKRRFGACPKITCVPHHRAHAASAFYPTDFDEALVFTIDGAGEYDATVIWKAEQDDLTRLHTYEIPNSLGRFYGAITEFLGYRRFNGEGKVMGLAPYGEPNAQIQSTLGKALTSGRDYDVTAITNAEGEPLRDVLGWDVTDGTHEFTQREKDLAFFAQEFIEKTAADVVKHYIEKTGIDRVCLAGGVVLNCKMNRKIVELPCVDKYFIQPVAHDAGLPLGAGWDASNKPQRDISRMEDIYLGPGYDNQEIRDILEGFKVDFRKPEDLSGSVADRLVDGELIGWFQGRMEMGPRALGNRSILADPRVDASRDQINDNVKHRENWRPFAPSMLPEAANKYLVGDRDSPFMIDTFETVPQYCEEITATLHPADSTTRPHIVKQNRNPQYYDLIQSFEEQTGVPVLLNTSFNDHGEPIIRTPRQAIRSFYSMGLDALVLNDFLIEK